tara:strand:- start:354 stop:1151 length:798 start_codon:yes stop_codon:yes gene_type:complete
MPSAPTSRAGHPFPERICLFGEQYTGKTRAVLEIAKWHQRMKSDAIFRIVDTDLSYERMLIEGSAYADLENLDIIDASNWQEALDGAKAHLAATKNPHDWLVMDRYNVLWDWVQDHFIEHVLGEETVANFWEAMRAKDATARLDGYKDWGYINKMYREMSMRTLHRADCHVLVVCTETPLFDAGGKFSESKRVYSQFGRMKAKPAGQKDTPNAFHTVIRMEDAGKKGWTMTAAKDREPRSKDHTQDMDVGNFWQPYLMGVGKWTL